MATARGERKVPAGERCITEREGGEERYLAGAVAQLGLSAAERGGGGLHVGHAVAQGLLALHQCALLRLQRLAAQGHALGGRLRESAPFGSKSWCKG